MAFAFVQANAAGSSAGSSVAVTLGATVGSGNVVLGTVSWGNTTLTALTSVTDDKGNTYTVKQKVADTSNGQSAAFFELGNITNAPKTLTATFTGALNFIEISAVEYSGANAATDPTDGSVASAVQAIGGGGGTATSGSLTTTVNGDLLVGLTVDTDNRAVPTAGSGYTLDQSSAAVQVTAAAEHQLQTTAGATAVTFTSPAGGRYITCLIAVKPAAGGNANVNPSGVSGTGSAGTLSGTIASSLTGVAAAGTPGSLSVVVAKAPLGVQAAGSAGSLAETISSNVSVTGVSATGIAGSVSETASASPAVTGVSASGVAGSVVPTDSKSVTGVAATGLAGTLAETGSASPGLAGVAATGAVGSVAEAASAAPQVTGVSASGTAGSLSEVLSPNVSINGVAATGFAGSVSFVGVTNVPVTGVAGTGAAGALSEQLSPNISITGVSGTGVAGIVAASGTGSATKTLTGVQAAGQVGALATRSDVQKALAAAAASGSVGQLTGAINVGAIGVQGAGQPGNLVFQNANAGILGVQAIGFAGSIVFTPPAPVELRFLSINGVFADVIASSDGLPAPFDPSVSPGYTETGIGYRRLSEEGVFSDFTPAFDGPVELTGSDGDVLLGADGDILLAPGTAAPVIVPSTSPGYVDVPDKTYRLISNKGVSNG